MGGAGSKVFPKKRLDGTTAVVTGANTGIGKITVKELYRLGARVIVACRDTSRANAAIEDIQNETKGESNVGELLFKELNLSSLQSVRKCAEEINSTEKEIHYLINNAGVMMCPKGKTEDGFETHFGINHLGHFLFTTLLLPKIIKSAPSKIITVSSSGHEKAPGIDWEDLNFEKKAYSALLAYCQSKLANILFSKELAKRLSGTGVSAFSLHPGIVRTELSRHLNSTYFPGAKLLARVVFLPFSISPEEGAKTTLYCVLAENENESGSYYSDCKLKEPTAAAKNVEEANRLWEESVNMVKLDFDPFKQID